MKQEEKKKLMTILIVLALIISSLFVGFYSNDSSKENYLLKTILIADNTFARVSIDNQMADQYYNEAGFAYEDENFKAVERECRLAREYYLKASQGYRGIKAELKATEIKDELLYIYIDMLGASIEMTNNLFEACEHFESVARYYDIYYNTDVSYGDMSYDMGSAELDMMNEKIVAHDEAVGRYNTLLEEFRIELEKRI